MKLWNHSLAVGVVVAGMFGASAGAQAPRKTAVELGSIEFPTSATPAAQAPFLTGVKALYNFEFDIAAEAYNGLRSGLTWLSTYVPRTLVPALMELLGKWNWWPSKLTVDSPPTDTVTASADALGLSDSASGSPDGESGASSTAPSKRPGRD